MDKNYIITTDLGGTLLDYNTYRFNKAAPALEYCDDIDVPIIFNTSKTFAETQKFCKSLNNNHPFIIENGSALYIPKGYFQEKIDSPVPCFDAGEYWLYKFGLNRSEILSRLTTLNATNKYKYKRFSSYKPQELSLFTGLNIEQMGLANERQFSEPLHWLDTPEKFNLFKKEVELFGLNSVKGGRFVHVLGQCNKGKPLVFLKKMYQLNNNNNENTLVALGDSDNDKDMFKCADIAIVIESPAHQSSIIEKHPHLIRSRYQGPVGWNDSVLTLLQGEQPSL